MAKWQLKKIAANYVNDVHVLAKEASCPSVSKKVLLILTENLHEIISGDSLKKIYNNNLKDITVLAQWLAKGKWEVVMVIIVHCMFKSLN